MAKAAAGEAIKARISRVTDWTAVVVLPPGIIMAAYAFVIFLTMLRDEGWPIVGDTNWISWIMLAVSSVGAWWFGGLVFAAAWRLRDRRPALVANAKGIIFHPSLCRAPIAWSEVKRIELRNGEYPKLILHMKSRFWSAASPFGSMTIGILANDLSWSAKVTEGHVKRMQRWSGR